MLQINVAAAAQKKRSGPSLGYENKIVGFYSTTTSSQQVRQDTQELQTLLQNKGVHKKASFTPWTPVVRGCTRTRGPLSLFVTYRVGAA